MIFLYVEDDGVIRHLGEEVAFFHLPYAGGDVDRAVDRALALLWDRGVTGRYEVIDNITRNVREGVLK